MDRARLIEAARRVCERDGWDLAAMWHLVDSMGIRWGTQGTRKQLVIALCFAAAMELPE